MMFLLFSKEQEIGRIQGVASVNSDVNHKGNIDHLSLKDLGKNRRCHWTSEAWLSKYIADFSNWEQMGTSYPGPEAHWERKQWYTTVKQVAPDRTDDTIAF